MNSMILALTKGIIFGITMAMIPGPIFILIIQRTLNEGALIGLLCSLGAVTADMVFAIIAAIGLSFVLQNLIAHQSVITFVGGMFLIYLGLRTFYRMVNLPSASLSVAKKGYINAWLSTFLLTLTNPVTILSYTMIFAGLGIGPEHLAESLIFVCGAILGALSFAVALVGFFHNFHGKLSGKILTKINKAAGLFLIIFGVLAIARALHLI